MVLSGNIILPICRYVNKFFDVCSEQGDYILKDGKIELKNIYRVDQYIALTGTTIINNIYKIIARRGNVYTLANADNDEEWHGIIYGLHIPQDFLQLCADIDKFNHSAEGQPTAYTSETVLNVHSWSKGTNKDGVPLQWQDVFKSRLNAFRVIQMSIRI